MSSDEDIDIFNTTYTSEGIPITTIYVSRIPNKIRSEDIFQHFGRFGTIVDYSFKQSRITERGSYALITYDYSSEASRAMGEEVIIEDVILKVSSAYFWYQKNTKIGNMFKSVLPTSNTTTVNEYVNIQDENNILNVLNEYCFMEIFSYLSLKQLIQSERVSKHWNYLVGEKYKGIVELKTDEWYGVELIKYKLHLLLFRVGRYLKTLHLNGHNFCGSKTPYMITKLCPNLNELLLVDFLSIGYDFLSKWSDLKSLYLINCDIDDETFKNCTFKLEILVIRDYQTSTKYFEHLNINYLTTLSLMSGSLLKDILSIERCLCMSNLKDLSLEYPDFDQVYIFNILKLLPQLESLSLRVSFLSSGLEPIADMKKLKTLQLHSFAAVKDELLMKIISNCTELTNLLITNISEFTDITKKTVTCLLSLKNLKFMEITGIRCSGMGFENYKLRIHCNHMRKDDPRIFEFYYCNTFTHGCKHSGMVRYKSPWGTDTILYVCD